MDPKETPGVFCQSCLTWNPGERESCLKCGSRLLVLSGDQVWEDPAEEEEPEEDLDEHLLERITVLEESIHRLESFMDGVSDQLARLERSEVTLRSGLMALVNELEGQGHLDGKRFSQTWEEMLDDNLNLMSARELFTRYRPRILPIARPRSMAALRRALLETAALLENGQLLEAAQRLYQAIPMDPKNYELLYVTASLLDFADQVEPAEETAQKVVQISPRHYDGWMLLAHLLEDQDEQVEAYMEALQQAAALRTDEVEPRLLLSERLLEEDDLQSAYDWALAAMNLERDGQTLLQMGQVLLARGEGAAAIPLFKEASEYLPGDRQVRLLLAEAYLQLGELNKSFPILQDLLQHYPMDPEILIQLDAQSLDQLRQARGFSFQAQRILDEVDQALEAGELEEASLLLRRLRRKEKSDRLSLAEARLAFARNPAKIQGLLDFSLNGHHPRLSFIALRIAVEHLMSQGRLPEAQAATEAFLGRHPKSTGAWEGAILRLAIRLMQNQCSEADLQEAKRLLQQPLPGREERARTLYCQLALSLKRPKEVLEVVEPLFDRASQPSIVLYFQAAQALLMLGDPKHAALLLQESLQVGPGELNEEQFASLRSQIEQTLKDIKSPPPGQA